MNILLFMDVFSNFTSIHSTNYAINIYIHLRMNQIMLIALSPISSMPTLTTVEIHKVQHESPIIKFPIE